MTLLLAQQNDLTTLDSAARLRRLQPRTGLDFSSNDYLGLARAQRLRNAVAAALARGVSIGSGGSRLLRGNDPEHEALEAEAAAFFGSEAALFFSSGYAANAALLSTLPQRGDLIVHDALIHASAHEGMRLARAESVATPHNDAGAVDQAIAEWRRRGGTGRAWIAVESLYSMDGDRAPLADLAAVAARHAAMLLIDEAHATGVFGPGGRGLAADLEGAENVITLRTCGKALGCEGALLCGPRTMRDFLVNRGRAFIFSTAPSPLMASAVRESLRILADEPDRRERLSALTAFAERTLAPCGVTPTGSQILPLIIGADAPTMRLAAALQAAGFDIRGIRPPTVPPGTARLRVSLTLNVSEAEIAALAETLSELRAREP
ncbi:8-amino-7-oxononanoate synthase [Sphingomonas sp. BE270]|jgi:8-amino-7-oxononanoate synthase|uniref:8-amino-7-oxononanoate synthase n=3 Tax=Sphingomonas TaxID=13687 RepID=UPI0010F45435|nr:MULTISPECIES: 8-amino-7-oxononanoate synthase [unclassified Sphingomonas]MDR6847566.1 8-amino-7-oxononanoate synthase [Sphingomonas sp. BE137]MDR7257598.1 8-amino-7-oxononanoate synthase [Sphingomonas sp. BE270]